MICKKQASQKKVRFRKLSLYERLCRRMDIGFIAILSFSILNDKMSE